MKRLALVLTVFLLAATVNAGDRYAIIFLPLTMTAKAFRTTMANIKELGGVQKKIDVAAMPRYFEIADPSNIGRVYSVRIDKRGRRKWKNEPLAQIKTRITVGISLTNKQLVKVRSAANWSAQYSQVVEGE